MTAVCQTIPATASHQRASWVGASCAIFVLAAVCFIFHLGYGPLAGTEGHRAITAEQMLENGNYLLPRLYGYLYLMKPPLTYWSIAVSEKIMGAGGLAWRLPSALASVLLATGICAITASWFDALAGFVAGIAFIAIVPLWSQNRSADVDAINHLGCVLAALLIIDIGRRKSRTPISVFVLATLGVSISLLTKGPAGLPIVIAAIIGPIIANRTLRPLGRPAIYLSLLIGAIPFVVWGLLVYRAVGNAIYNPDISGLAEAQSRMVIQSASHFLLVLALPFTVLAYGLPVSGLLILPLLPRFVQPFDPEKQYLIRALLGCVVVAFVIQMLSGMINPRYAFLDLPILCPLAGALAYGVRFFWRERGQKEMLTWPIILAVIYCIIAMVVLLIARRMEAASERGDTIIAIAGFGCAVVLAVIIGLGKNGKISAFMAIVAICGCSMAYGFYKTQEENVRSAGGESAALAKLVTPDYPLISWNVLWSQPELFYYAHLDPLVQHLQPGDALPSSAWLVLDGDEWSAWQKHPQYLARLKNVHVLRPYKHYAYVCWYSK